MDKTKPVETLPEFLAKRNAVFRNPTPEAAAEYWRRELPNETPVDPTVPLATVHKARLQWLDATDAMLVESAEWLTANGYETTSKGAPPLTPEQRDKDRVAVGKPPLAEGG